MILIVQRSGLSDISQLRPHCPRGKAQIGWTPQEFHPFLELANVQWGQSDRNFAEIEVSRFFLKQVLKPISLRGGIDDFFSFPGA